MARLLVLNCSTNSTLSTILRESFLLSKVIVIIFAQQTAMMQTRSNMTKLTMIQGVSLVGTVALASIQASAGLARQLRQS